MTGFGSALGQGAGYVLRVELRSVNHRFLQVGAKLPGELASLEPRVAAAVRARLARGSVTVALSVDPLAESGEALLDLERARAWDRRLRELARALGHDEAPRPEVLLSLPGVVAGELAGLSVERHGERVLALVEEALDGLVAMREAEGRLLEADLRGNAAEVAELALRIRGRMPEVVRHQQEMLRARLDELLAGRAPVEPAEIARELALIADRADVSEELARLESHLEQLGACLAEGGVAGRKLEFLIQEMVREINTTGAKCLDSRVSHWVVETKTRIERLREQVQNVE